MLEIFISDVHYPYEDKVVMGIIKTWIKKNKPELVWLGGDIVDFAAISKFDKHPMTAMKWKEHKLYALEQVTELRKTAPKADFVWYRGNHEERLIKYLWKKAPELSEEDAVTVPELFKFDELDIRWIPSVPTKVGHLTHIHGHERPAGGVLPAKSMFDKLGCTLIMGHFHKVQLYTKRQMPDGQHGVWLNGCACELTPEYDMFPLWDQSFTVIEYAQNGLFHVEPVIITYDKHTKRKCGIWGGDIYYSDKVEKIRR